MDQRPVAFMLDSRRRTKIKNEKVQLWRMELAPFSYVMQYRHGQRNVAPDTLTRAYCSATNGASFTSSCVLQDIHDRLCYPGSTRMLHFIRSKNLPYSTNDAKRIVSACTICARLKPLFVRRDQETLIKAMRPMKQISIYFKGPLPSSTLNKYLFIVIDEYSRFPFAFQCKFLFASTSTVIKYITQLFTLCGTASFVLSDNASSFCSLEFKAYLEQRGISSNKCRQYLSSFWKCTD